MSSAWLEAGALIIEYEGNTSSSRGAPRLASQDRSSLPLHLNKCSVYYSICHAHSKSGMLRCDTRRSSHGKSEQWTFRLARAPHQGSKGGDRVLHRRRGLEDAAV